MVWIDRLETAIVAPSIVPVTRFSRNSALKPENTILEIARFKWSDAVARSNGNSPLQVARLHLEAPGLPPRQDALRLHRPHVGADSLDARLH